MRKRHEIKTKQQSVSSQKANQYKDDRTEIPPQRLLHSLSDAYEIQREIGHGSQGTVFLATRRSDGKQVSVKRLNIGSVKTWKDYMLFKREGNVLKSLDIDGVARCYDTLEYPDDDPPCAYIVQEYIPGKSLQSMLKDNHHFEMGVFYDIVVQLLTILDQLHHHDPCVIHRDIKPSNILLEPKPGGYKVWLIDFGAVANPQLQSGGSTMAGTYGYMPPEQLMGKPEPASDIYALGAVIVHVLSGVSPGDMQNRDFHLMFEPELQSLHPSVVKILRQMLEPNVKQRLCDIDVLKRAFSNFRLKQFELDGDSLPVSKQWSAEQYNKKLTKVAAYGAEGNIELWSQLPDKVPRKIPECYQNQIYNIEQIDIKTAKLGKDKEEAGVIRMNLFKNVKISLKTTGKALACFLVLLFVSAALVCPPLLAIWMIFDFGLLYFIYTIVCDETHKRLMRVIAVLITGLPIVILQFCMFYNYIQGTSHWYYINFIIFGLLSIISLVLTCIMLRCDFSNIEFHDLTKSGAGIQINNWLENKYLCNLSDDNELITRLIASGRKTIARVISIEYMRCPSELILNSGNMMANNPVYFGVPTFKISYSFNPPDDLREEDLVHSFETHTDPSELLHVGDPLPILYDIQRNKSKEVVVSIPFPLVLDDPVTARDVVCQSATSKHELAQRKRKAH